MIAQYTETLQEYIDNGGNTFPGEFAKFPHFTLGNLDFNIYEMFCKDNRYKEIGAETEELFEHYLSAKLDENLIEYVPKINMFIDNFSKLLDRKISLIASGNSNTNTNGLSADQLKTFLNPTSTEETLNSIQEMNKRSNDYQDTRNNNFSEVRESAYSWFKSNPELLSSAMQIKSIYLDCLRAFDTLFMGVL